MLMVTHAQSGLCAHRGLIQASSPLRKSVGSFLFLPGICAFLFTLFLHTIDLRAQADRNPAQHTANDVVIVSLETLGPSAEHRQHVREGLLGNSASPLQAHKPLLDIQMNIVREAAKFGPVLVLAPDEATRNAINQRCEEFQLCPLFQSDRVRLRVVAHDGVWIRDFGPQIGVDGDSANVVSWRYFDSRAEQAKQEKFQELETARLQLIETRQQQDQPDEFTREASPDAHKALISAIDDKLYLLREYSQILSEASVQRFNDGNSAFDIADAVLARPDFSFQSPTVALDGGNLFQLEDGRCLTTRVLRSRNKDQTSILEQSLEKIAGCRNITFLEPLPGPVIEHIDMFALPVGGKRILLASYDLSKPFASGHWAELSDSERDLALRAAIAMQSNAERLSRLGYEVIPVPSPFPRIPANGHTYYPTVLNALIRTSADGYKQILLPSYKDYETDIQSSAQHQIAAAFGPQSDIVTIESTEAAKAQGAVHCLTLTVPLRLSIFGDPQDAAIRSEYRDLKNQLDRQATAQIASQIPAAGLQGSWAVLQADEQSDETPLDLYPQSFFFRAGEFQKGVFHQLETAGTYTIDRKDLTSWSLHFHFPDHKATPAIVQWLAKDQLKLIFDGGTHFFVLRQSSSSQISPFTAAPNESSQFDGAAPRSKKLPSRPNSEPPAAQASNATKRTSP